jgi:hypothetical protein
MTEARADELGVKPLETEFAAIDRITNKADLARYFGRMFKLQLINPLVGYVEGDARQPDQEILYVIQGGLGLPDREYYLKDDPTIKEYRAKYVALLTDLLKLSNQPSPDAAAKDIFAPISRPLPRRSTSCPSSDGSPMSARRSFNEKHFRPEAKARMDQLVDNLRRAFREGIEGLEWMGRDEEAGAGEARQVPAEGRLSEQVARLLTCACEQRTISSAISPARFLPTASSSWARWASRSIPRSGA